MFKRRRFKQSESLTDRLATFANLMRERAQLMSSDKERDNALRKAEQADRAIEMERWVRSSELKHPE